MLACRVFGHRMRFSAEGAEMRWSCARGCGAGGAKAYASPDQAARYAAAFDREAGIHWLAQAEHIYRNLGTQMWPECDVRDQAMAALGIDRIPPAQAPDPDYQVTLDAALAWLRSRPEDEVARF
jgi:hypothetical protein